MTATHEGGRLYGSCRTSSMVLGLSMGPFWACVRACKQPGALACACCQGLVYATAMRACMYACACRRTHRDACLHASVHTAARLHGRTHTSCMHACVHACVQQQCRKGHASARTSCSPSSNCTTGCVSLERVRVRVRGDAGRKAFDGWEQASREALGLCMQACASKQPSCVCSLTPALTRRCICPSLLFYCCLPPPWPAG